MQYPTQSATIFGAPFAAPVKHTVLPVGIRFQDSVRLMGYIPIPETAFTGTETTFALGGTNGSVPVISVTRPLNYKEVGNTTHLVEQLEYMAVLYDRSVEYNPPWVGISTFIPGFKSGYYTRYVNTSTEHDQILSQGNIIGSLRNGMATTVPPVVPAPTPPAGQDATLRWNAALNLASLPNGSEMFDFQWVALFQSSLPVIKDSAPTQVLPLSIDIVSQPTGREFVATLIQNALSYVGQGLPMNHAIRIIKLASTVPPGNFTFGFKIKANVDGVVTTKDVTLTLQVVGGEAAP
jgi:hypothetical protein